MRELITADDFAAAISHRWQDSVVAIIDVGKLLLRGSWLEPPVYLRASFRDRYEPVYRYKLIGFRCAREVSP